MNLSAKVQESQVDDLHFWWDDDTYESFEENASDDLSLELFGRKLNDFDF
jgi:hypothetical protein